MRSRATAVAHAAALPQSAPRAEVEVTTAVEPEEAMPEEAKPEEVDAVATKDANAALHDAWKKGHGGNAHDVISPADSVSQVAQGQAEATETTASQRRAKVASQAVAAGALFVAGSAVMQYALDRRSDEKKVSTSAVTVSIGFGGDATIATDEGVRGPEQVCLAKPLSENMGFKTACVRWAEGGELITEPPKRHLPRLVLEKLE